MEETIELAADDNVPVPTAVAQEALPADIKPFCKRLRAIYHTMLTDALIRKKKIEFILHGWSH